MTRREWQILVTLDYPFLSSIFGLPRFLPRTMAITPLPLGPFQDSHSCSWQDERAERLQKRLTGLAQDSPRWSTVHRCYVLHTVHMTSAYISPHILISSHWRPFFPFLSIFRINCNSFHAHDSTSARAAQRVLIFIFWENYANVRKAFTKIFLRPICI